MSEPSSPEIVDRVIKALKLDPNQVYSVKTERKVDTFIPSKLCVRELLSQYLDLNGRPNRSLLRAFLTVVNKEGQSRIEKCLGANGEENFKELTTQYNIGEFIEEFVKYGEPSLELIMSTCPQIQPRLYSIASSPLKDRNQLELAVANVLFGNGRHGLCTHYLNYMDPKIVPMKLF